MGKGKTINAQSFSNSFEWECGVVRKSRGEGGRFCVFLIFMTMFFEVFSLGIWGASSPLCIYGHKSKFSTAFDECSLSLVKVLLNFFYFCRFVPAENITTFQKVNKVECPVFWFAVQTFWLLHQHKIFHPIKKNLSSFIRGKRRLASKLGTTFQQ